MAPYEPTKHPHGYLFLGRRRLMHRVVATCWLDKPDGATQVHHINENKADNRAENLEWVTPRQHFNDRHQNHGHYKRTEETRRKLSAYRTGLKDGEETRQRKAAILSAIRPKTPCRFRGVEYPSVAAGARAAGMHTPSFRVRCLSKNFPEYELLIPPC